MKTKDIRERNSFKLFKVRISALLPKGRAFSIREIREHIEIEHYWLGLILEELESEGIISVDRSNPQITRYSLGGKAIVPMPIAKKQDWNDSLLLPGSAQKMK